MPRTGILHHQSHWPSEGILIIYSFIHVCLLESPRRSPPTYGEKQKVTVHRAPRRWKVYIQWGAAWFPKGTEQVKSINIRQYVTEFKLNSGGAFSNRYISWSQSWPLTSTWWLGNKHAKSYFYGPLYVFSAGCWGSGTALLLH